MKRTTYQVPELRDENDNIIQQGAFGKNTALANSTNDGWIDYVANDLMYLYNNTMGGTGGTINTETITGKTGTITSLTATTVKAGTVTADALNGPLTGNVTGDVTGDVTGNLTGNVTGDVTGDVTGNLTGNVTGTADKAVADGKGNNIVNTYVTKSDLSSSVSTTSLTVSGETSVPTANAGNSSKAIANTEYVQGELTNYLPLSGGTVSGNLTVEGTITGNLAGNADTATNATNATNDANGNPIAGTYLPLAGGNISGSLTVGNKEVERINTSGSKYIRYENGIQICWGNGSPSSGIVSVTFPLPFIDNDYKCFGCALPVTAGSGAGRIVTCSGGNKTPSSIKLTVLNLDGSLAGTNVDWFAIGYWK